MGSLSCSSLRVRLVVLVVIAILPAMGATLYTGLKERYHFRYHGFEDALMVAQSASSVQERVIENSRQILFTLSQLPQVYQLDPVESSTILANVLEKFTNFTGIFVAKPSGEVIASAPVLYQPLNISTRHFYKSLIQNLDFVIGEYQIGVLTGKSVLSLAYPVLDERGQLKAILFAGLDLTWLNNDFAKTKLPDGSVLTVIDHNGTILLRSPYPKEFIGESMADSSFFNAMKNDREGVKEALGLDGITRLYGFKTIGHPFGNIYVSVGIPKKIVFAEADQGTKRNLTWLAMAGILALIVVWFGGDIILIRSVNRLLMATKLLTAGNLSIRASGGWGKGEIAQLAQSFDQMAESLQRREEENKQAQAALRWSEERLKLQIERMPIGCILWDTDFRVVSWNPAAEKNFGFSAEETLGEKPYGFIVPKEVQSHVDRIWKRLLEGDETAHSINENLTKDGRTIICEWFNTPIKEDNGAVIRVLSMVQDITERKQMEEFLWLTQFSVDHSVMPIIWVGEDGRFLYSNEEFCRLLGYTHEELPYMTLLDIDSQVSEEVWRKQWLNIKQKGSLKFESTHRTKNGRFVPVSVVTNYMEYKGKEQQIAFISDITEQKRSEEQLKKQMNRMAALRMIDMAITGSLDLRVTLNVFLDQCIAQLRIDVADILLLDPYTHKLVYFAGHGFRTEAFKHTSLSLGEGYGGQAAAERRIIHVTNIIEEPECSLVKSPLLSEEGFVSYYGVPLIAKGYVKGVLEVFHRSPLNPDQDWFDFLEALANQAAIAIDNAALFMDLQCLNTELLLAYDTTLEGWSRALDLRDKETEGHSKRVTEMTLRLARTLGIHDKDLIHMRRGALLHDIGKMGIPDSILLKPGPLTDEEWQIMRTHTILAYRLLSPVRFLQSALDIPYCHHEKWDGTGYPRGLKEEEIPIAARIFAVIDVWDALSSERPYRSPWPEEKVFRYIQEEAGKHFDPKIIEMFLKMMKNEEANI
ncbi:MAG: PAS domain S-box protein [Candidatus Tectomicrobia bacterium]|uniref:PAS domain S-box protein n=1 Tax=Tectimicrobiota bacterium TaxID=2528274 RepID=A0A933GN45_UNCTE|nr:PAS domain S-box protein [Candidatus Tectomicrobia bacterium]